MPFSQHKNTTSPLMSSKRTAIIGAMLTAIGPITMALYTPAMPQLAEAFSSMDSAVKLSLSLYFFGFAVAQLIAGPMSDAYGRRTTTMLFLIIFLVGSITAIMAHNIETLIIARLVQGIGASVGITVSRAIVRDQYTGIEASNIMNLIGIILAVGPAVSPTIGGILLAAFGWESIFVFMLGLGLTTFGAVYYCLVETTTPDKTKILPTPLIKNYKALLTDRRFVYASFVLGGSVGALYAQATMLTFILIDTIGLTPTQFGMGMLMQSGAYFLGSLSLKFLMPRIGDRLSANIGIIMSGIGGLSVLLSIATLTPGYLSIMIPVGIATFGIGLSTPYIITLAMAPFPKIAGSASAMMGFIQMGSGFLGGVAASLIGTPVLAFGIIIPAMQFIAVFSYVAHTKLNRKLE